MKKFDENIDEDNELDDVVETEENIDRRAERRKRRVKNQIISYSVISIILIAIGIGIYFLSRTTVEYIHEYLAPETENSETVSEEESAQTEDVVIEAPQVTAEEPQESDIDLSVIEDVDYLGEAVEATISQMTIEDKVSQLFILTPEALTGVSKVTQAGDGTRTALDKYAVGGLIYGSSNIVSEDQIKTLLETTASMSKYDIFLGTSETGGKENVISTSSIASIPQIDSPEEIGATGDSNNAYNAGLTIASYMSALGFNLNLSPDGSVISDENSVAKNTSFGSDEALVFDMDVKMIEGMKAGNIFACMTGFPGNGNITDKTADGTVECDISSDELEAQLVPYISGIAAGANLVMLNNVIYTNADTNACPASVSKYIIGNILRDSMGYTGIVVTAPMNEAAITGNMTSAEAAIMAIKAGADMIAMPDNFEEAYSAICQAVADGDISEDRIDESLERIFRVKLRDDIE